MLKKEKEKLIIATTSTTIVMKIDNEAKYIWLLDIWSITVFPPKIRATDPKISILTILDPNMSPRANDGLGGSSKTADILAESSGKEVAKATNMLPTKSLPRPVIDASISPYFAK